VAAYHVVWECVVEQWLAERKFEDDGEDNESLACNINSSDKTTMQMTISDSFS